MLSPLAVGLLKGCGLIDAAGCLQRHGISEAKWIFGGEDKLLPQRQEVAGNATKRQRSPVPDGR
jgi:hypothetical protein